MNARDDILVPISVGELMDKITILEIKFDRIKNSTQLENIARELGALRAVRLGNADRAVLDPLSAELKQVNAKLWDVEDGSANAKRAASSASPSSRLRARSIGSTTSGPG